MPFSEVMRIGRCIYCGATDDLRREHIVPAALNGDFVLQDASCGRCEKITNSFEHRLLRSSFGKLRARLGMRSRRKEARPTGGSVNIHRGSYVQTVTVPIEEYPAAIILPRFGAPRLGTPPHGFRIQGFQVLHLGSLDSVVPRLAPTASMVEPFKPIEFARLLGKIGYGFAVATCGVPPAEEVLVLRSILGEETDLCNWVGEVPSANAAPSAGSHLHTVSVRVEPLYVVASVRLFAMFGAPEYTVIVGRTAAGPSGE